MKTPPPVPERPAHARRLDRWVTRGLRLLGRLLGRPDEGLLNDLTGRSKGGAAEVGPGRGEGALQRGRRAMETGQLGDALFHFAQAAQADPQDPWAWHGRGDALQLSDDFEGALAAYDRSLELEGGLALSHNGRGNALRGLGQIEAARACWRRALELDSSLPWPARSLSETEGPQTG